MILNLWYHDDVIKWKHFMHYWPFVRGIHWSPVNSPHKGQWRGALMFFLICAWINGWVNNAEAGHLRCHGAHYDVTVMIVYTINYTPNSSATSVISLWCVGLWMNHFPPEWWSTFRFYVSKGQLMCKFDMMDRNFVLIFFLYSCLYSCLYTLPEFYLLFFLSNDFTLK